MGGEIALFTGNPAFLSSYNLIGDKPLGCGMQACTWKVTKKEDPNSVYTAKIYRDNESNRFFRKETEAIRALNGHIGYT